MSHLFEQDYHEIDHISGPMEWWEARERQAAWIYIWQEADHKVTDDHWMEGNWSSASGSYAIVILFQQDPEMDAVFVAKDQKALGVM